MTNPWNIHKCHGHPTRDIIEDKDGEWIAMCRKEHGPRIVSCVNACEGINPEAIKDFISLSKMIAILVPSEGLSPAALHHVKDMAEKALAKASLAS